MKKILAVFFAGGLALGIFSFGASAQMMREGTDNNRAADDHTAREEQEGKAVWKKLQTKETSCALLKNDDFALLGEYFMGTMLGDSHQAMNQMMTRAMGPDGEEQMHVVMGKRLSDCDASAQLPASGLGFMPMMTMMGGGWGSSGDTGAGYAGRFMNVGFYSLGGLGIAFVILWALWWLIVITGASVLVRWIVRKITGRGAIGKTALDILKERYARGEIDKREFDEKKNDLAA